MNVTTLLAIFGAVTSGVLALIKVLEWSERRKNLFVRFKSYSSVQNGYKTSISGRYGDQYISISVANKASTPNTIVEAYFEGFNLFLFMNQSIERLPLNFIDETQHITYQKMEYSETGGATFPLSMPLTQFEKSKGGNIVHFEKLLNKKVWFRAVVVDSFGKTYYSNKMKIQDLVDDFYKTEEDLTILDYRQRYYPHRFNI